jgi:hypothetical protein
MTAAAVGAALRSPPAAAPSSRARLVAVGAAAAPRCCSPRCVTQQGRVQSVLQQQQYFISINKYTIVREIILFFSKRKIEQAIVRLTGQPAR